MSIFLTDRPGHRPYGGLWFLIPDHLNAIVAPWIRSRLPEVKNVKDRQHYRAQLTKTKLRVESADIWLGSSQGGGFVIYNREGRWRIGDRGIASSRMKLVEAEIISDLQAFYDTWELPKTKVTEPAIRLAPTPAQCLVQLAQAMKHCVDAGMVGKELSTDAFVRLADDMDRATTALST